MYLKAILSDSLSPQALYPVKMRAAVPVPRSLFNFPQCGRTNTIHSVVKVSASQALSEPSKINKNNKHTPPSQILRIRKSLLSREQTAVEIAEQYLTRLQQTEPYVKSFLHISDKVLTEASEIDNKIARNEEVGVLAGVPIAVKDNLCTKDMPATAGSRVLEGYRPPFDATAITKLRQNSALLIGKTNLDEFGMGSTTEGSAYQVTSNPWILLEFLEDLREVLQRLLQPGSVQHHWEVITGGSIRQPASFCGVVGLKPTYGRVSRFGLMAYASSLDVVGCLGSSVMDTAILLGVMAGHDKLDATSSKSEVPDYSSKLVPVKDLDSKPLKGIKVGIICETMGEGVDSGVISSIQAAALHLEELGATLREVSFTSFSLGLPAYYVLAPSEASSNLARYDSVRYGCQVPADDLESMYGGSRAKGFGPEVKRRILTGTYALSAGYYDAYYKRAQQVRTLIQRDFSKALEGTDILISPAAPTAAYKIGEKSNDPLSMYAGDIMTVNVNMAGLPALVVPCGFVKDGGTDLPVGLQMIGGAFEEGKLLQFGHIFQQTLQNFSFLAPALVK